MRCSINWAINFMFERRPAPLFLTWANVFVLTNLTASL